MNNTNTKNKIEFSRFGYNAFGLPTSAVCEIDNLQFLYIMAKNAEEKEKIEIYDLKDNPVGYGAIDAKPIKIITYDQSETIDKVGYLYFSLTMIELYFVEDSGVFDALCTVEDGDK